MSNIFSSKLIGVNFNEPTFIMVGGISIDDIKIKYNWFLNAEVKDAIIGEDKNGLIWYSGIWVDGTWENGTWYSGTWYDGRWKNGNFYSYDVDITQVKYGKVNIKGKDITKSNFISGSWEGGNFHYGTLGRTRTTIKTPSKIDKEFIINYSADFTLTGETLETYIDELDSIRDQTHTLYRKFKSPEFKNGHFYDGWMNGSKIYDCRFYNGYISSSIWYNGTFYNGVFLGNKWYNGNFYGGDFSNGVWYNGIVSIYNKDIKTRFGTNYNHINSEINLNGDVYTNMFDNIIKLGDYQRTYNKYQGCIWKNGKFISGEFHSELILDNNIPIESYDHTLSIWENGEFINGDWYGGTFNNGVWYNGVIHNSIINNIEFKNGYIKTCTWKNGTFINGYIEGGLFENMEFLNGEIGV